MEISKLKNVLQELKNLIMIWKSAWPKLHKRVLFLVFDLSDLPALREDLNEQMHSIDSLLNQASHAGGRLSPKTMNEMERRLRKIIHSAKQHVVKHDTKCKAAKRAMKETGINKFNTPRLDLERQKQLISNMVQAGMSTADAEKVAVLYTQELEKQMQEGGASQSETQAIKSPEWPESCAHYGILFVDRTNGARSIMAQAYMELVRTWTANNQGPWLFGRVASAGLYVESEFRRNGGKLVEDEILQPSQQPALKKAVDTLAGPRDYFFSEDGPKEKETICNIIKQQKRQGIHANNFFQYHYILCFEQDVVDALQQLSNIAQKTDPTKTSTSRILLLPGCEHLLSKTPFKPFVGPMRVALKNFLASELNWTRPNHKFANGPFRTRFLCIKTANQKTAIVGENWANLKKLSKLSQCRIHVSFRSKELGWVVAIVGPKAALPKAERLVKACYGG